MNRQTLVNAILIGIIFLLLWFHSCEVRNFKEEIALKEAANDTLKKKVNKDGSQTATIALLQARDAKQLLQLKTNDETIKQLQEAVKSAQKKGQLNDGGSVTVFTTSTTFTDTSSTVVDTSSNPDCATYHGMSLDTTWVKWSTTSDCKDTRIKLKVKNAYTVVIGSEWQGLFKKRKPIVDVTSRNPFTDVQSLRAFEVKDTRKERFSFGIQAGYGMTIHGLGPYIGVGGQFKLFGL